MPELPEVETIRRGLKERVVGKTVLAVNVIGKRTVRRHSHSELVDSLLGRSLHSALRYGKYLVLKLDEPSALVIHLRMSGRLVHVEDLESPSVAHTHARFSLSDGTELCFIDPRTFGELFITKAFEDSGKPAELAGIGLDPLLDLVDANALALLVAGRRTCLKGFLLDQSAVAGMGNIYSDEICFAAKLNPAMSTATLGRAQLTRLATAITQVLNLAVELGGSSLRDASYKDLTGNLGRFQEHHCVYARAGRPCVSCGSIIQRVRLAGRMAHFCPNCQC